MNGADTSEFTMPPRPYAGGEYKRDDEGTFLQCWSPIMLSEELIAGKIYGQDYLGTRVIVYRSPEGQPVVQSAYCPHMGADLSCGGELKDGAVRCPYHQWKFAETGQCVEIPEETTIPGVAKIYNYPAAERWGFVWVFNGEKPLYDLPEMPNVAEEDLIYRAARRGKRPIEGWIGSSNIVDFLHLKTVHGVPDPFPTKVEFTDYLLTVRQESPNRIADTRLHGCTWLTAHMQFSDGTERFFMAGGLQVAAGWSDSFFLVAMRKSQAEELGPEGTEEEFKKRIAYIHKLYSEDEPILYAMRFRGYRKSALIRADRHMGEFLRYHDAYPRAKPFDV